MASLPQNAHSNSDSLISHRRRGSDESWRPRQDTDESWRPSPTPSVVFSPRSSRLSAHAEDLIQENDALTERVEELLQQNLRLRSHTEELDSLRALVADREFGDPTVGVCRRGSIRDLEHRLKIAEEQRARAERAKEAEEETREKLLEQLSLAADEGSRCHAELGRLGAALAEAEGREQAAVLELRQAQAALREAKLTLDSERQLLIQERAKNRQLEGEADELRSERATAAVKYGIRRSRRFVTYDLMSQLHNMDDEEEDEDEEGSEGLDADLPIQQPEEPELSGANHELLEECEDLRRQGNAACRALEDSQKEVRELHRRCQQLKVNLDLNEAARQHQQSQCLAQQRRLLQVERHLRELQACEGEPWWTRLCFHTRYHNDHEVRPVALPTLRLAEGALCPSPALTSGPLERHEREREIAQGSAALCSPCVHWH